MRICMIAAAFLVLPVLAACGSDSDTAPTVTQADIAKSLQDKGLDNAELANCAARIFVDQGISQAGLRALISDEYDTKAPDPETLGMSAEDADKARAASSRIAGECITGAVGSR
ncbi:hypothetical protein ACL02S_05875 [Nocardia sp. 004]|uniref:hypothetical protein n=1 Tax=Nocardia sp. 004 TaxID=3385978 RepID=UPI0039A3428A